MRKNSKIILSIVFILFSLILPQKSNASTAIKSTNQMDVATLYWIYFGKPFPMLTRINPKMKITVPSLTPVPTIAAVDLLNAGNSATLTPTPLPKKMTTQTISLPVSENKVAPVVTSAQAPLPTQAPSNSKEDMIISGINAYRASLGLGSVSVDTGTCNFAQTRADEIVSGFNHDGFTRRVSEKNLPYSSYHQVTENIAMTTDEKEVVKLWINSPTHAENMRQDTPYVCVKWNGDYYAYEGLKP